MHQTVKSECNTLIPQFGDLSIAQAPGNAPAIAAVQARPATVTVNIHTNVPVTVNIIGNPLPVTLPTDSTMNVARPNTGSTEERVMETPGAASQGVRYTIRGGGKARVDWVPKCKYSSVYASCAC